MKEYIEETVYTKVILVGVDTGEDKDFEHSMEELKSLAEACFKEVAGVVVQKMQAVNTASYIGSGKVAEVKAYAAAVQAEEVIFDNSLTPSQMRNLGNAIELPILDRTNLILEIFALRAKTKEAKLQVESASLQYMLPRLVGMRDNLSRQGGTGGSMSNKGAGETKLELDRRHIEHRISELRKELDAVSANRDTQRKKRERSGIPQVALVGYTNAGKSTILNKLVSKYGENKEKTVLEKDMLFATLDTNVRMINTADRQRPFYLADTVGFIDKLPHSLVKAFRSTLEEVKYADLVIQVVDYSDDFHRQHMEVTQETLRELGAGDIPQIVVFNKADICQMQDIPKRVDNKIYIAAGADIGLEELIALIKEFVYRHRVEAELFFPFEKETLFYECMRNKHVISYEYGNDGIRAKVDCDEEDFARYKASLN